MGLSNVLRLITLVYRLFSIYGIHSLLCLYVSCRIELDFTRDGHTFFYNFRTNTEQVLNIVNHTLFYSAPKLNIFVKDQNSLHIFYSQTSICLTSPHADDYYYYTNKNQQISPKLRYFPLITPQANADTQSKAQNQQ